MKRHFPTLAAALALGAMLAGCGGSGGPSMAEASATAAQSANGGMDAFLTEVRRILGMTSDTSAPVSIDHVNVTAPDNAGPAPLS
jgi:predicted small lipoprotein YifL